MLAAREGQVAHYVLTVPTPPADPTEDDTITTFGMVVMSVRSSKAGTSFQSKGLKV